MAQDVGMRLHGKVHQHHVFGCTWATSSVHLRHLEYGPRCSKPTCACTRVHLRCCAHITVQLGNYALGRCIKVHLGHTRLVRSLPGWARTHAKSGAHPMPKLRYMHPGRVGCSPNTRPRCAYLGGVGCAPNAQDRCACLGKAGCTLEIRVRCMEPGHCTLRDALRCTWSAPRLDRVRT